MRRNALTLAAGAAGLLAMSVVIGFLIGRSQRPAVTQGGDVKGFLQTGERAGAQNAAMLPSPIAPDLDPGVSSFSFVLDRADSVLVNMEPVPLRFSDLLANRAADVRPDVKPFVLNNEEFDVLIEADELAEP
jgi:hypothetical protein